MASAKAFLAFHRAIASMENNMLGQPFANDSKRCLVCFASRQRCAAGQQASALGKWKTNMVQSDSEEQINKAVVVKHLRKTAAMISPQRRTRSFI
jgi:hypothetical protein